MVTQLVTLGDPPQPRAANPRIALRDALIATYAGRVRNPVSGSLTIIHSSQAARATSAAVVVADRTSKKMARVDISGGFPFTGTNPQKLDGAVIITVCKDGYLVYGLFDGAATDQRQLSYDALQSGS